MKLVLASRDLSVYVRRRRRRLRVRTLWARVAFLQLVNPTSVSLIRFEFFRLGRCYLSGKLKRRTLLSGYKWRSQNKKFSIIKRSIAHIFCGRFSPPPSRSPLRSLSYLPIGTHIIDHLSRRVISAIFPGIYLAHISP